MNDLMKAITYNHPEKIPVSVGILPVVWLKHGEKFAEIAREYPDLIPEIPDLNRMDDYMPASYHMGSFTDEWGCVWSNLEEGMESIVTGHPLPNRENILTTQIPPNRDGRLPHGFMYLRYLDLRGFEEAMLDFAEECDEMKILLDKIVEYNCYQIEAVLPRAGEVVYFGDDLGMQKGLAIGPHKWRKYLKPCFAKMYKMVKDAGKYVYMHTDGMIYEIIPDLKDCGVDMVNPQFRANGLDNIARVCKGKIAVDLDLDRQLFPFATPSEIEDHVRQAVETLYMPEGGLAIKAELGQEIPLENVVAILDALRKYQYYKK